MDNPDDSADKVILANAAGMAAEGFGKLRAAIVMYGYVSLRNHNQDAVIGFDHRIDTLEEWAKEANLS